MNPENKTLYIGDIARETGLSPRAVRYYEELGFIKPTRTEGGFRTYDSNDIAVLKLLIRFKALGMTLEDIRCLLPSTDAPPTAQLVRGLREALEAKRSELMTKMRAYEEAIGEIDRVLCLLSNCPDCGCEPGAGTCARCLSMRGGADIPLIRPLVEKGGA